LIGILDWGLGHASRSVPVIRYFLQFKCQIFIAATGGQKKLLEQEFPELFFVDPPAYNIKYAGDGKHLVTGLLGQVPRLLKVIKDEKRWVDGMVARFGFDVIISDNRYGFRHKGVLSIFFSHQLAPISGFGRQIDNIINILHVKQINKFDECWIPDGVQKSLAGKLSHPAHLPKSLKFIGPLSRFTPSQKKPEKKNHLLIILSGPEPGRSAFEQKLLIQLETYRGTYVLVRGLPAEKKNVIPNSYNHLPSLEMKAMIEGSSLIVCRSGYTSIMDLVALGRTAVLVPTPGQTEQEYLAQYLVEQGYFLAATEKDFVLEEQAVKLQNFSHSTPGLNFDAYTVVIDGMMNDLKQRV
jgi:UDP:flavonoid glycosyltransferase YjiC (YdhE family)